MGRALELSFIALIVIIVAFVVVPWVFDRSSKAKRELQMRKDKAAETKAWEDQLKDLDGPDGPHGRPTV